MAQVSEYDTQIAEGAAGRFGQMMELEQGLIMERIAGEPAIDER